MPFKIDLSLINITNVLMFIFFFALFLFCFFLSFLFVLFCCCCQILIIFCKIPLPPLPLLIIFVIHKYQIRITGVVFIGHLTARYFLTPFLRQPATLVNQCLSQLDVRVDQLLSSLTSDHTSLTPLLQNWAPIPTWFQISTQIIPLNSTTVQIIDAN